ncbi:3',5'-cyclic-nucleotide phosphodiesterase [Cladophialophora psammophila CBS 110553]|uniref:Phosphodiesterase n=1 Tax=Cladophialophora psammophila CBS 110553 TaxID=1182543 RepID=W9XJT1_9EURO|nr:3',5'-cyclic-nucleotide phosphodiesterase [Cladophialophora psammophila CBS 110553]EXJ70624.1 3',5'-cyclic-nucleotide phosphodiesterase [Cladophialophora psammophila CBS 110553]
MDPSACRVIYIDERFNTERWISREGLSPTTPARAGSQVEFSDLPLDLQTNVNAFLTVFNQVYVCSSGRAFSTKLSELHDQVKLDCTPILACIDVGSESKHEHTKAKPRFFPSSDSPLPSPSLLRKEITFSSESDESYGLQLLSRIASDLQVDEGVKLIIPVAIVSRAPFGPESKPVAIQDKSDIIDAQLMLQCLDAGALDVVKSPLDKAGIMGLTVHAYRIYKNAKKEQAGFMAMARRNRKQSWVGMEEEKPYAYLREAMVKKLLKGICEPQNIIEDYQHRDLYVQESRKEAVAEAVGRWDFSGHDFTEDELVYAGYFMLNHCLQMEECEQWSMNQRDLLHFMQGCRIAYNSFVLYHNFRHAVDVLQSVFYFLLQIGTLPPYPAGAQPSRFADKKSPIARLLGPFEALTLLVSAIGHDVGHPGVNNMFLVKLNAPLAQLYNDQSVLEAFHCAAYSQILRRHWHAAFLDKALRKLMISTILATDMGIHSDYMQQLGNLQEKIHESGVTDGWSPKDIDWARTLTCGLLIKCADISNVARPWLVAEKWTHLLQKEFAHQGEMEQAVGMETTLFGGPPELGNMLKLANGQIGFMTIFAHPLFANVADIIPAMRFAADEILTNKGVWFTRAEHEKKLQLIKKGTGHGDGGSISPRTQSPVGRTQDYGKEKHLPTSPLRGRDGSPDKPHSESGRGRKSGNTTPQNSSRRSSLAAAAGIAISAAEGTPRRGSASKPNQNLKLSERERSGSALVNGEHIPMELTLDGSRGGERNNDTNSSGTPRLASTANDVGAESLQPLNDKRRDNAVSMRAGTEAIPQEALEQSNVSDAEAMQKFNFATSKKDEPVRTYDPQQQYNPSHPGLRASAPASDVESKKPKVDAIDTSPPARWAQSDNTSSAILRGGGDKSEELIRLRNSLQAIRNRAHGE